MRYQNVIKGVFRSRPNRFIAQACIDGVEQTVHVKNTGRCRELLLPGSTVYLSVSDNPDRKTKYDLIAVEKERSPLSPLLVNMDSQAPNAAAEEWLKTGKLFSKDARIRREVVHGASRFDFYIEDGARKAFLEVKGVTLENQGIASFPDAPTLRGIKHLTELSAAVKAGYEGYVLFVIQMKDVHLFTPNDATHRAFGDALRQAAEKGVQVLAMDCLVTPDTMTLSDPVNVKL